LNFDRNILEIKNIGDIVQSLQNFIHEQVYDNFRKRGIVIGISGGIDSAVAAKLCCDAIGKENVLGIILPEKESNPQSQEFATKYCEKLGIKYEIEDVTSILDSSKIYQTREKIVEKYFPDYNQSCEYRLVFSENFDNDGLSIPYLEVNDESKQIHKIKLSLNDYFTITAATNIKHRIRMTRLYFYAEKNNFLVTGTTNKAEFQLGYFVKYGDGGVDIEPLANLYKTQVYQLGKYLDVPNEIIERKASPDTWSFDVSDEEFFYSLPYETVDLVLFAKEKSVPLNDIYSVLDLKEERVKRILNSLERKWKASKTLRVFPPSWNNKDIL
jgi:NAD+ synthase|tara:strand:+ start:133 stop:1113 length:981 start_codon:yes stop_codon:yes gene_type:complete